MLSAVLAGFLLQAFAVFLVVLQEEFLSVEVWVEGVMMSFPETFFHHCSERFHFLLLLFSDSLFSQIFYLDFLRNMQKMLGQCLA